MKHSPSAVRQELRKRRSALNSQVQQHAAHAIVAPIVDRVPETPGIIAGYVAHGGEIDPMPALLALQERGWSIVLPICGPDAAMSFHRWTPGAALEPNRYGIGEPQPGPTPEEQIDVVLVPGVGFSPSGQRIGHGVGYYDRYFARNIEQASNDRDALVALRFGLAHDLQVGALPGPEPWDVPMHAVITPHQVIDTEQCA